MRIRRTSRLILIDKEKRVLLFRIEDATVFRADEPSPVNYWITPGGSLEAGRAMLPRHSGNSGKRPE